MSDPFNLERFISAQQNIYEVALDEIRKGKKRSHWMWFIFPQFKGLGSSSMAEKYSIKCLEEAEAFLEHPLLSKRLLKICEALMQIEGTSAYQILGTPDDMKLRSSMTLFSLVKNTDEVFQNILNKYFNGMPDEKTIRLVEK